MVSPSLSDFAALLDMNLFYCSTKTCILSALFVMIALFLLSPVYGFRNMNNKPTTRTSSRSVRTVNTDRDAPVPATTRTVFATNEAGVGTHTRTCTDASMNAPSDINHNTNNSVRKILDEVSVMFEERKAHVRKLLDDFSQPFMVNMSIDAGEVGEEEDDNDDGDVETIVIENCSPKIMTDGKGANAKDVTHFCFLVHGYNGKPADLLYLRSAMVQLAQDKISSSSSKTSDEQEREREEEDGNRYENVQEDGTTRTRMIMHTCQCNWKRTHDGVEKGGERILGEILSVIEQNVNVPLSDESDDIMEITVSLVGNSLGGLYSRYAIARLAEISEHKNDEDDDDDDGENDNNNTDNMDCDVILMGGKVRVHFNIFCTTATPHLGIAGHTWIPLPRTAELGIGSVMGQTGKDIFRISDLLKTMCTCPTYLRPLSSFRKRIAYANAYQTDFVVPTQTAAFLNPDSTYPHHVSSSPASWDAAAASSAEEVAERDEKSTSSEPRENEYDIRIKTANNNRSGMVVATLHTPPGEDISRDDSGTKVDPANDTRSTTADKRSFLGANRRKNTALQEELLEMSNAMDQLGWKKVIVDLREQMPISVRIPRIARKRSGMNGTGPMPTRSASSELDSTRSTEEESSDSGSSSYHVLESRDVAHAFSRPDDVLAFPLGHNTMVAVEKSIYTSSVFKGGRPLMDDLAKELVDEIFIGWDKR